MIEDLQTAEAELCRSMQPALSAYLDGELELSRSGELIHHLEICIGCTARLRDYCELGQQLRLLPAAEPPPGLGLRLRVLASHHSVRGRRWLYWKARWISAIRALALPTAVGTASALVLFFALAGGVYLNVNPLLPDVPLGYASPPRLTSYGNYPVGPVLVEVQIDASGHVYGYRLLSGPATADTIARLNNELSLSVFQPAHTADGQPTTGSVLLSFGTVDVRG